MVKWLKVGERNTWAAVKWAGTEQNLKKQKKEDRMEREMGKKTHKKLPKTTWNVQQSAQWLMKPETANVCVSVRETWTPLSWTYTQSHSHSHSHSFSFSILKLIYPIKSIVEAPPHILHTKSQFIKIYNFRLWANRSKCAQRVYDLRLQ